MCQSMTANQSAYRPGAGQSGHLTGLVRFPPPPPPIQTTLPTSADFPLPSFPFCLSFLRHFSSEFSYFLWSSTVYSYSKHAFLYKSEQSIKIFLQTSCRSKFTQILLSPKKEKDSADFTSFFRFLDFLMLVVNMAYIWEVGGNVPINDS